MLMLMRLLVSFLKKKKESTIPQNNLNKNLKFTFCLIKPFWTKTIEAIKPFEVKKPIVTTATNNQAGSNRCIFLKQWKLTLFKQYKFQQHSFFWNKVAENFQFPFFFFFQQILSRQSICFLSMLKQTKTLFFSISTLQANKKLFLLKISPSVFFNFVKTGKSIF